jgi:ribonuclease HI
MSTSQDPVFLYTDGACSPNPGKGGYGIVLIEDGKRRELSGGVKETTNNRMELLSVIAGLQAVQGSKRDVLVISDSRYVVDSYSSGHAREWRAKNWMRTKRAAAKNPDLWDSLLTVCESHNVVMNWVAGHAGNAENERCDELAVEARLRDDLPDDEGYLKPFNPPGGSQPQLDLF